MPSCRDGAPPIGSLQDAAAPPTHRRGMMDGANDRVAGESGPAQKGILPGQGGTSVHGSRTSGAGEMLSRTLLHVCEQLTVTLGVWECSVYEYVPARNSQLRTRGCRPRNSRVCGSGTSCPCSRSPCGSATRSSGSWRSPSRVRSVRSTLTRSSWPERWASRPRRPYATRSGSDGRPGATSASSRSSRSAASSARRSTAARSWAMSSLDSARCSRTARRRSRSCVWTRQEPATAAPPRRTPWSTGHWRSSRLRRRPQAPAAGSSCRWPPRPRSKAGWTSPARTTARSTPTRWSSCRSSPTRPPRRSTTPTCTRSSRDKPSPTD